MIANITDSFGKVIPYTDPVYSLVPIPWAASAVITLECLIIVSYLRSKPPLSQTIMDFMIGAFFIGSIPWSLQPLVHYLLLFQLLYYWHPLQVCREVATFNKIVPLKYFFCFLPYSFPFLLNFTYL